MNRKESGNENNSNDLLLRIQNEFSRMSKGQKQIAQYILDNYDKAAFITASKMGKTVGVSESTVVRFAYAMGYDGYPELQKSLQELIRNKLTSVQRIALNADMQEQDLLKNVLKADMANIRTTIEMVSMQAFVNVVDVLNKARRVYVVGMRSSTPLAQFMAYYLNLVLDDVRQVSAGPSSAIEQLVGINEKDALIAISFPRYSKSTVNAIRFARERQAFVAAITDSMFSPLTEHANECLVARSDMASFVDSLVAPLSLINAIIVATGRFNAPETTERFQQLEQIWNNEGVYIGTRPEEGKGEEERGETQ